MLDFLIYIFFAYFDIMTMLAFTEFLHIQAFASLCCAFRATRGQVTTLLHRVRNSVLPAGRLKEFSHKFYHNRADRLQALCTRPCMTSGGWYGRNSQPVLSW